MEGAGTEETQQTKTQLKSFAPLISHVKKTVLEMLLKMLFFCQLAKNLLHM